MDAVDWRCRRGCSGPTDARDVDVKYPLGRPGEARLRRRDPAGLTPHAEVSRLAPAEASEARDSVNVQPILRLLRSWLPQPRPHYYARPIGPAHIRRTQVRRQRRHPHTPGEGSRSPVLAGSSGDPGAGAKPRRRRSLTGRLGPRAGEFVAPATGSPPASAHRPAGAGCVRCRRAGSGHRGDSPRTTA